MASSNLLLQMLLILLAIDCLIEVGFIGSMVSYLHISNNDVPIAIASTATTPQFGLFPKPGHVSANQGHTSNGAAGTALLLVSLLGFIVLRLQARARGLPARQTASYTHVRSSNDGAGNTHMRKERTYPGQFAWLAPAWVVFTVLSWLLTLSALVYTFVITKLTEGSRIDLSVAAATYASREGEVFPYPEGMWTPETWFKQVLSLGFVDEGLKGDIRMHLRMMEGVEVEFDSVVLVRGTIMVIAVSGWVERRREVGLGRSSVMEKHVSTVSEL